jgi:putative ABC transport system substrate-binding protein
MRRRDFIGLLGCAAATWPLTALAQQSAKPVIGYLSYTSPSERPTLLAAFLQGLEQAGYVDGRNVRIEYRSAEGHYERLPSLVAELVSLPAAVIAATGGEASGKAAKAATSKIPIVFTMGTDPVKTGLVTSLNRPEANVTGVALISYELDAKRLQLLHELIPKRATVGILVNTKNPSFERILFEMKAAAQVNGQRLMILDASTEAEIESAFASVQPQQIDAVLVTTNPFYEGRRKQLVEIAERYSVPVVYPWREYSTVGGLISYGPKFTESYRQAGLYVGRILKGEKPAELPVVQATEIELLVNLKTAKRLSIEVPTSILLRASDVIE